MNFIDRLETDNKCIYLIMPLIRLSKDSFGLQNFINCYISANKYEIYVLVKKEVDNSLYINHKNFKHEYEYKNGKMLVFGVPDEHKKDYKKMIDGSYSVCSQEAIELIFEYSKLRRNDPVPNKVNRYNNDSLLLGIIKAPELKNKIEEMIDMTLPETAELISMFEDCEFIENL